MKNTDTHEKFDKELNDLMEKLQVDKRGNPLAGSPAAKTSSS